MSTGTMIRLAIGGFCILIGIVFALSAKRAEDPLDRERDAILAAIMIGLPLVFWAVNPPMLD